jgi:hypothetical protein
MNLVGRKREKKMMARLLTDDDSNFLAVYGRRRIGKTYLIRQFYEKNIVFEVSGLHEKDKTQQLENFWFSQYDFEKIKREKPKTWLQAFQNLKEFVESLITYEKKVIFLDEIAWFETQKSGFLAALDKFWNQFCSKRTDIILVICGSAASWIINKVINNKGGLHNRITCQIQLLPFNVKETKEFLQSKNIQLVNQDIIKLYMIIGGIPYYLRYFEKGQSVDQFIESLFFKENAVLKNEFANLYASSFKNSDYHIKIVKALASKNKGLTRSELLATSKLNSGGGFSEMLNELVLCGFIKEIVPLRNKKEDILFRLVDEYTLFYLKFLFNAKQTNWLQYSNSQQFKIWQGFSFENFVYKHIDLVKKELGISGIISNEYSWYFKGTKEELGTQIDLVIDRSDNCITLLEIKFHNAEFITTKDVFENVTNKKSIFIAKTKTKKNVFVTMVSLNGAKQNEYFSAIINNQVAISELV